MNAFSKRLKETRQAKGMTQLEVANILGTTKSSISRYELGESEPTLDRVVELAKIYGVTVDFLIQGELQARRKERLFTYYEKLIELCEKKSIEPDDLIKIVEMLKDKE